MPRKKITLSETVDRLSILDEKGRLDEDLEPNISDDVLLKLHRTMLLGRRFDERLLNLQRQGRIGTFAPIKGQEAAQLGTIAHLRPTDWMVPAFRETAAEIWRGRSLESVIYYFNGFNEGGAIPDDRNDFPISVPVGSQMIHAVGLGWAAKYRQTDDVAMTYFGDGATSQGDFHEALNFAAVFQAPVIFVCQNNQWAISIPVSQQTRSQTLAQKALAYGMPGIQVDGNDILAVYAAAQEAVQRARSGDGPTLIECVTYRLMMHTTADDPKRYRADEEVEQWIQRDPLPRFEKYLADKGLLFDEKRSQVESEVLEEIQAAIDRAEKQMETMGDPIDMFNYAYAEIPPHLKVQKEMLTQALSATAKEGNDG